MMLGEKSAAPHCTAMILGGNSAAPHDTAMILGGKSAAPHCTALSLTLHSCSRTRSEFQAALVQPGMRENTLDVTV